MSSSIFFKFKSQKEPTRLPFDGTAISVFDAKRDIIAIHKLGDGTDFDLAIYDEENNEEYVDDTVMIPRGTAITARRLPPAKPGRGTAQRYVTGKMPTAALSAGRIEKKAHTTHTAPASKSAASGSTVPGLGTEGQTEEERIAAMFQASSEQWNQTQEQMANARPIHGQGGFKKKNAPAPSHPPPTGYVCYRCGEKGHWIQQCPTNADPNFDGRPRVKRTTGIPKSFLKTVDKPVITDDEDGKPVSVMVNAEGEYVVAEPDKASWELFQQKTKAAGLTGAAAAEARVLEEKGLACPIDNKLFKDAVKTPCCGKTYCDDCIQNALVESDLVCPNCDTKDVLLDRLITDTETREKVKEYLDSKKSAAEEKDKEKEKSKSPTPAKAVVVKTESGVKMEPGTTPKLDAAKPVEGSTAAVSASKKRPADDDGTVMKRTASSVSNDSSSKRLKSNPLSPNQQIALPNTRNSPAMQNVGLSSGPSQNQNQPNNNNPMNFPQNSNNNFMNNNMGGNMNNMNNMNGFDFNGMGNMMMGNNGMGFNNGGMGGNMNNMNNMNMNMGMNNMGMNNGMMPNSNMGGYNNNMNMGMNNNMGMMNNNMGMNNGAYNNNMGGGYGNMNMNNNNNGGGYNGGMNNMGTNNGYYNNNNNGYNNQHQQYGNQWGMQQQQQQQRNNNMGNQNISTMGSQNQGWTNNMNNNLNNNINANANTNVNANMNSSLNNNMNNMNAAAYQARKIFSEPFPTDEDSPYMRKPVNPYRHMRPKRARPSDYTAVGGGVTD
ncbi:hypothetical protein H072_8396 [Dactylellina haptotyla CBS 200.50]|uniref:DWNN domain-containing protein n=1 Tax=Dactylellina haptotyla (strain CBS 200.50) TaxID=1284197 RepID=S8A504_DACHA|nr:hypothetical protein H072_8396 [Dactylellina haptotyla CBS 200.50]